MAQINRLSRYHLHPAPVGAGPGIALYFVGKFLRVLAVYSAHAYLSRYAGDVVYFVAASLIGAALLFLGLQQPWRGRPLTREQWAPVILSGTVLVLSQLLWTYALKNSGPIRSTFGEYASVALTAVTSAAGFTLQSRPTSQELARRLGGAVAVLLALFLLSQSSGLVFVAGPAGTATTQGLPLSLRHAVRLMLAPSAVGLLSMLRKALDRHRASKAFPKKRMHALSVGVAATLVVPICALHALTKYAGLWPAHTPPASTAAIEGWGMPMLSAVAQVMCFAWVLFFYIEGRAEEQLGTSTGSLHHVAISAVAVCMLQVRAHFTYLCGMETAIICH